MFLITREIMRSKDAQCNTKESPHFKINVVLFCLILIKFSQHVRLKTIFSKLSQVQTSKKSL